MKKGILVLLVLMGTLGAVLAGPVSAERARTVATNFAYQQGLKMLLQYDLMDVTSQTSFEEFYIFTGGDGKGFVLVSKDDRVMPILGYSESNAFLTKGIPEHIEAWLEDYDNQIQFNREHDIEASQEVREKWAELEKGGTKTSGHVASAVGPLMTTTWDQLDRNGGLTYNKFCPTHGDAHCVTGCVATAMAQVMKYWNWPRQGRGSKEYTYDSEASSNSDNTAYNDQTLSANFANVVFDWENMPDALTTTSTDVTTRSTDDEIDAVATLIYNVGIAVSMQYGTSGSSAYTCTLSSFAERYSTTDVALRNYFHYKHTANMVDYSGFTNSEWITLMKMEINAERPVLYSGRGPDGGHAFVLDGYDANDQFHVNWGWGGHGNGYYAIGALNPPRGGAGGNSTYTFNLENQAVIGIEPMSTIPPEDGTTTVTVLSNNDDYGTVSGSGTYANYDDNLIVLSAYPASGYTFRGWSDGNRENSRYLRATGGNQTYTAFFSPNNNQYREYYNTIHPGLCSQSADATCTEWGIKLPAEMISSFNFLDKVVFYAVNGTYRIKVYVGGDAPSTDNLRDSSSYVSYSGWVWDSVTLETPIAIDQTNPQTIWITMESSRGYRKTNDCAYGSGRNGHWVKSSSGWSSSNSNAFLIRGHFGFTDGEEPQAPTNVRVNSVSSNGATVSWTAPSTTTLTPSSYDVAYGVGLFPETMEAVNVSTITTTLSGLRDNTYYNVYVKANYRNDLVASEWVMASFHTYDVSNITNPVVVTAVANEESWGTVTGSGTYNSGSEVTLTATAMPGYQFVEWEDHSTSSSRRVWPTSDATYTAYFSRRGYTVTATGENGTVAVEGEDSWTSGDATCYPYLSTVSLTATPSDAFKYWNDGNTTNPRYITVTGNASYTATFGSTDSKVTVTSREHEVSVMVVEAAPVVIYDMLGRCVYRGEATTGSQNTVTLQAAGVYLVRVGNSYAEKIVVR